MQFGSISWIPIQTVQTKSSGDHFFQEEQQKSVKSSRRFRRLKVKKKRRELAWSKSKWNNSRSGGSPAMLTGGSCSSHPCSCTVQPQPPWRRRTCGFYKAKERKRKSTSKWKISKSDRLKSTRRVSRNTVLVNKRKQLHRESSSGGRRCLVAWKILNRDEKLNQKFTEHQQHFSCFIVKAAKK